MPRAKAFSRSKVEQRWPKDPKEPPVDPALIEKLVALTGVIDPVERAQVESKLSCTIKLNRDRVLADQQERPAQIVAALKPVLRSARDLSARLNSLPVGLRLELQAGGLGEQLEALISKADDRLAYWRQHVAAHRPTGEGATSLDLRQSLTDIFAAHCLGLPPEDRAKERKLRDLVAYACQEMDVRFPDETKHRRRFMGEQKRPSKPGPKLYLRPLRKSAAERRLKRRLKDVPI
jgi:hypothetical protein